MQFAKSMMGLVLSEYDGVQFSVKRLSEVGWGLEGKKFLGGGSINLWSVRM